MELICIDSFGLGLSDQVTRLMLVTNELSLPFCQLVVLYLHGKAGQDILSDDQNSFKLSDVAFDAIKPSIERGCNVWSELFEVLMGDLSSKVRLRHYKCSRYKLIDQIRGYAETKILNAAAAYLQSPNCVDFELFTSVDGLKAFLDNYLDAVICSSGSSNNRYPPTLPLLMSTLKSLLGMNFFTKDKPDNDREKKLVPSLDDREKRALYCIWCVYFCHLAFWSAH